MDRTNNGKDHAPKLELIEILHIVHMCLTKAIPPPWLSYVSVHSRYLSHFGSGSAEAVVAGPCQTVGYTALENFFATNTESEIFLQNPTHYVLRVLSESLIGADRISSADWTIAIISLRGHEATIATMLSHTPNAYRMQG
jgi:hypothetical protein